MASNPPAPHSALTFACKTCDELVVRRLLDSKVSVNELDAEHQSPLLCAVEGGHVLNKGAQASVIALLISCKADLNTPSFDGRTPIWCACRWGLINVMRQLVEAKADPTKKCAKWGESAIDVAIRYKRVSLLQQVKLASVDASQRLGQFLRQYSELELQRKVYDHQQSHAVTSDDANLALLAEVVDESSETSDEESSQDPEPNLFCV
eukprot:INCI15479.3.p1 GENE.INCI15479.3~~INCI15479.3.p1  ORF type:complete len:207 (+),score=28.73 INCI15479.3:218-838(+)